MTAETGSLWGSCLAALGRFSEAEPLVTEGYRVLREARGRDHADTRKAWERLVALYEDWGRELPPSIAR